MGKKRRGPPRPQAPTLIQQEAALRQRHPWLQTRLEGGALVAEGLMRPSALSRTYRVRIRYEPGRFPKAEVLDPVPVRRLPEQCVPHTNGADSVPCLFTPRSRDWTRGRYLADSVVPWLAEWLIFYEGWRATGAWDGGGTLPEGWDIAEHSAEAS